MGCASFISTRRAKAAKWWERRETVTPSPVPPGEERKMAPTAPRDSFVSSLASKKATSGRGHLLSGTNGLRKTIIGETLAHAVMATSQKPKINYDKMKVGRRGVISDGCAGRFASAGRRPFTAYVPPHAPTGRTSPSSRTRAREARHYRVNPKSYNYDVFFC